MLEPRWQYAWSLSDDKLVGGAAEPSLAFRTPSFAGNKAEHGGAFDLSETADPATQLRLRSSAVTGNAAALDGGAFHLPASAPLQPPCTTSSSGVGAQQQPLPCVLSDNTAGSHGPTRATLPVAVFVTIPRTVRSGRGGLSAVSATLRDALNQSVRFWGDMTLQVVSQLESADIRDLSASGGAAGAGSLLGLTVSQLQGGVAAWPNLGLDSEREGAEYNVSVVLVSPSLPLLQGAVASATVAIAQCEPSEVFTGGECRCRPGWFLSRSISTATAAAAAAATAGNSSITDDASAAAAAAVAVAAAAAAGRCLPCPAGTFSADIGMGSCAACGDASFAPPASTACRTCPDFSRASRDGGSCFCRVGFYAAEVSAGALPGVAAGPGGADGEMVCLRCPHGGVCPGDNRLYSDAGWWRASRASANLYKCPPGVCLAEPIPSEVPTSFTAPPPLAPQLYGNASAPAASGDGAIAGGAGNGDGDDDDEAEPAGALCRAYHTGITCSVCVPGADYLSRACSRQRAGTI